MSRTPAPCTAAKVLAGCALCLKVLASCCLRQLPCCYARSSQHHDQGKVSSLGSSSSALAMFPTQGWWRGMFRVAGRKTGLKKWFWNIDLWKGCCPNEGVVGEGSTTLAYIMPCRSTGKPKPPCNHGRVCCMMTLRAFLRTLTRATSRAASFILELSQRTVSASIKPLASSESASNNAQAQTSRMSPSPTFQYSSALALCTLVTWRTRQAPTARSGCSNRTHWA
eukprot:6461112-Amphidinium_carterae.1